VPIDHGTGSDDDRSSKLDETSANRREPGRNHVHVFFSFYSLYLPETCRLTVCYFHLVFSVPHLLVPLIGNRQDHDPYGYQLGAVLCFLIFLGSSSVCCASFVLV
jgi:hypothetical protein